MRAVFFCCVCLVASPAFAEWKVNLAHNPSVEDDANHDQLPDAWQASAYDSLAKLEWDDGVARSGRHSLRIRDTKHPTGTSWKENTGRWISAKRFSVTPGATYTLEAWIKTQDVTGRAVVQIAWWNQNKWLAESTSTAVSGTCDWQRVTVTAKAPPEADTAMIYLGLANSQGTAWYDDINMIEGNDLPRDCQPVILPPHRNLRSDMPEALGLLTPGDRTLRGVRFHVASAPDSQGPKVIVLRGQGHEKAPPSVTIPVGRQCDALYFLHGCLGAQREARVGQYDLLYEEREFVEHRYVSDTGELVLDRTPGVLLIQTPKIKGLVGFLNQVGSVDLGGLTVEGSTPFAAVVVSSLDGQPLGTSRRMLITAVARAENFGQAFSAGKQSVPERGRKPVLAEPVRCTITLALPGPATVFPLDPSGKRRSPVTVQVESQTMRLNLEGVKSPWCEVVIGE